MDVVLSHGARNRFRSALIVSEVALSLMLLAGAGLLINSFWRLMQTDAGFDPKSVLTLDIPLSRATYKTRNNDRLRSNSSFSA